MAVGYKTGGRKAGTPNRSTAEAKRVLHEFVEKNSHMLTRFLHLVAEGIPKMDPKTGEPTSDFLVKPNPAKAFDMLMSALEFELPKIARTVVVSSDGCDEGQVGNFSIFKELLEDMKTQRQNG
jgi:hypothetical protein